METIRIYILVENSPNGLKEYESDKRVDFPGNYVYGMISHDNSLYKSYGYHIQADVNEIVLSDISTVRIDNKDWEITMEFKFAGNNLDDLKKDENDNFEDFFYNLQNKINIVYGETLSHNIANNWSWTLSSRGNAAIADWGAFVDAGIGISSTDYKTFIDKYDHLYEDMDNVTIGYTTYQKDQIIKLFNIPFSIDTLYNPYNNITREYDKQSAPHMIGFESEIPILLPKDYDLAKSRNETFKTFWSNFAYKRHRARHKERAMDWGRIFSHTAEDFWGEVSNGDYHSIRTGLSIYTKMSIDEWYSSGTYKYHNGTIRTPNESTFDFSKYYADFSNNNTGLTERFDTKQTVKLLSTDINVNGGNNLKQWIKIYDNYTNKGLIPIKDVRIEDENKLVITIDASYNLHNQVLLSYINYKDYYHIYDNYPKAWKNKYNYLGNLGTIIDIQCLHYYTGTTVLKSYVNIPIMPIITKNDNSSGVRYNLNSNNFKMEKFKNRVIDNEYSQTKTYTYDDSIDYIVLFENEYYRLIDYTQSPKRPIYNKPYKRDPIGYKTWIDGIDNRFDKITNIPNEYINSPWGRYQWLEDRIYINLEMKNRKRTKNHNHPDHIGEDRQISSENSTIKITQFLGRTNAMFKYIEYNCFNPDVNIEIINKDNFEYFIQEQDYRYSNERYISGENYGKDIMKNTTYEYFGESNNINYNGKSRLGFFLSDIKDHSNSYIFTFNRRYKLSDIKNIYDSSFNEYFPIIKNIKAWDILSRKKELEQMII